MTPGNLDQPPHPVSVYAAVQEGARAGLVEAGIDVRLELTFAALDRGLHTPGPIDDATLELLDDETRAKLALELVKRAGELAPIDASLLGAVANVGPVNAGDVVLARLPALMSTEAALRARDSLRAFLPGAKVLVVSGDTDLEIHRQGGAVDTAPELEGDE